MVIGIISVVLSAIVFITAITAGISAVFQQQVQYLMYICAAILFVGGFILLKLNILNSLMEKQNKLITELCRKMGCSDASLSQINDNNFRKEVADGKYNKSVAELIDKFNSLPEGEEKLSIAYELIELGETSYKKYLQ